MITIISLSEQTELINFLRDQGHTLEIRLIETHLNLTETRSLSQLLDRLENGLNNKITSKSFDQDYKDRIKWLNENYPKWMINDCRILWFYDQWLKLNSGDVKTICFWDNDNTDYNGMLNQVFGNKDKDGYEGCLMLADYDEDGNKNKIDYDEILAYVHN